MTKEKDYKTNPKNVKTSARTGYLKIMSEVSPEP